MTEAYVLAGELHRTGGDLTRAFAAYDARLRSFATAKQKAAVRLRGFFAPETALALKARNVAIDALGIAFFTGWLLARFLQDDLDLPKYLAA
jgi:2-polyprenyl-6-methoxyphenol hydroxylase-like FAD-dependent oxidoreductase